MKLLHVQKLLKLLFSPFLLNRPGNVGGNKGFKLFAWLDALSHCSSALMLSNSLFCTSLLCKEEALSVKKKFKGLELLIQLPILAVEVKVTLLCLESESQMVKFLPLVSVTAWHFFFLDPST